MAGDKAKTVDRQLVYNLAAVQCTTQEIAEAVGLSQRYLEKRFQKLIEQGRAEGRKSLRRKQFEKAMNGDSKLLVWLGKQWLSQKDNPEDTASTMPLPWTDDEEKK
jgi:AraC-like DNA-binding protein